MARFIPEIVVSEINVDLPEIDVADVSADLVEEISVVRYYNNSILEVDEKVLEPFRGFYVEVVGRLVEYKHVRVAEKGLREKNFDFLLAVEFAHRRVKMLCGNFKRVEKFFRVAFRVPAAEFRKLRFEFAGFYSVLVGKVLFCV